MLKLSREVLNDVRSRWSCLEEAWQRGYSLEYRVFRLKEALGLLGEDGK